MCGDSAREVPIPYSPQRAVFSFLVLTFDCEPAHRTYPMPFFVLPLNVLTVVDLPLETLLLVGKIS